MVMTPEYSRRNFKEGPPTYTSKELFDKIFSASGLSDFKKKAVVVDLMSGPGLVASAMRERAPQHSYTVLDASQPLLDELKVKNPTMSTIRADVRDLPSDIENDSFDVALVRYGLKDIPKDQQSGTLVGIYKKLKPGGVLVIADMVSPEEPKGAKEWNNMQHSRKQQLGIEPRDIVKEGECHIPTEQEWLNMLKDAGFEAEVSGEHVSLVKTTQWVASNQINDESRKEMDRLLLQSPPEIMERFKIREENGIVNVEYPVVIIRAVKKEVKAGLSTSGTVYEAK